MSKVIVPLGLVLFTILKVADGSRQYTRGWLQSLVGIAVAWGAKVGGLVSVRVGGGGAVNVGNPVSVGSNKSTVGDGSGVFVGAKVSVRLSVGGGAVFVGAAVCVCATEVDTLAATVFSRFSVLIVGAVGAAAQPLTSKTRRTTEAILTRRNYPLVTTILSLKWVPRFSRFVMLCSK